VPLEARDLPDLSPEYAADVLAPAFADAGLRLAGSRWMEPAEVAALGTTWAKRLSHRSPPRSLLIEASVPAQVRDEDQGSRMRQQEKACDE
jgi:hypothetical protein